MQEPIGEADFMLGEMPAEHLGELSLLQGCQELGLKAKGRAGRDLPGPS